MSFTMRNYRLPNIYQVIQPPLALISSVPIQTIMTCMGLSMMTSYHMISIWVMMTQVVSIVQDIR